MPVVLGVVLWRIDNSGNPLCARFGLVIFCYLAIWSGWIFTMFKELSSYCSKVFHLKMASLAQRGVAQVGGGCGGDTDNVAICQFVSHVKAEEKRKRKKSLFWRPLYD